MGVVCVPMDTSTRASTVAVLLRVCGQARVAAARVMMTGENGTNCNEAVQCHSTYARTLTVDIHTKLSLQFESRGKIETKAISSSLQYEIKTSHGPGCGRRRGRQTNWIGHATRHGCTWYMAVMSDLQLCRAWGYAQFWLCVSSKSSDSNKYYKVKME